MPGPRRALPFIEDVTVHPTEVPGYVDFLQRLFDREHVDSVMYGHVGDGNIHTRPLLDPKDPADLHTMQLLYDEVSAYVRGVRGTMSGEHGDGLLRTPYLRQTYGDTVYSLFSLVKNAFDPQGLMNPGKKVGPQEESGSLLRDLRYGFDYRTLPQEPLLHFPGGEYEREIEKCHGCAQCKSTVATTMCPTYKATRREAASPRAKANLLRAIITGRLDPDSTYGEAAMKSVTDWCIECGMCAVECPSNVNIPKLMLEAKSKYRAAHRGSPMELLLGHAEVTSSLGRRFAPVANPLLTQPLVRRLTEPLTGVDRRRRMPRFARRTLGQTIGGSAGVQQAAILSAAAPPASGIRPPLVAYFSDLYAAYNDPELGQTVLRLLAAHGIEVVLPEQRSSGIPEMLYGYADAARETAGSNVATMLPWVQTRRRGTLRGTHRDLRLQGALSGLPLERRLFHGRRGRSRPGRVPRPLPRRSSGPVARRRTPPRRLERRRTRRLSPAVPSQGPGDRQSWPGVAAGDTGARGHRPGGRLLRHGRHLRHEEEGPTTSRCRAARRSSSASPPSAPDLVASECSTCRLQIAEATSVQAVHPVTLLAAAYGV